MHNYPQHIQQKERANRQIVEFKNALEQNWNVPIENRRFTKEKTSSIISNMGNETINLTKRGLNLVP
jgi:hypothetical protein